MGKNKRNQKRRRDSDGHGEENPRKKMRADGSFDTRKPPLESSNKQFITYYKGLNMVKEEEWDAFIKTLEQDLPITFRITGSRAQARAVRDTIENEFLGLFSKAVVDGQPLTAPHALPWYPHRLAWQVNTSKSTLRRDRGLKRFHEFLVTETAQGNLSRQEAVSMIPALFLEVEPHHLVLDLCAAPGSKTVQLLERLHSGKGEPTGFVIANDNNRQRAYMLVHQTKRLRSQCFVVTNHDAQFFPRVVAHPGSPLLNEADLADDSEVVDSKGGRVMRFDRVLADVPCSGDGTLRKSRDLWKRWNVNMGPGLHKIQLAIGLRAAKLTKVGGMMVYSTCSFNPIEDEAVVAEILRMTGGAMELMDVSDKLPGLIREPGMYTWKIMLKDFSWHETMATLDPSSQQFTRSMFPGPREEMEAMHMERAMRLLPHKQDTGGFFIAVLRKTRNFVLSVPREFLEHEPEDIAVDQISRRQMNRDKRAAAAEAAAGESAAAGEGSAAAPADEAVPMEGTSAPAEKQAKQGKPQKTPEDNFQKLPSDSSQSVMLKNFFGLGEEFPYDQLLVRSAEQRKTYYVGSAIRGLLDADKDGKVKIINAGLNIIDDNASKDKRVPCPWRLVQEGIDCMAPYITKQRADFSVEDFVKFFGERMPQHKDLSPEGQAALAAVERGSYMAVVQGKDGVGEVHCSAWKGNGTTNLLVGKTERGSLLYQVVGAERASQVLAYQRVAGADKGKGKGAGAGAGAGAAAEEGDGDDDGDDAEEDAGDDEEAGDDGGDAMEDV